MKLKILHVGPVDVWYMNVDGLHFTYIFLSSFDILQNVIHVKLKQQTSFLQGTARTFKAILKKSGIKIYD